MNLELTPREVEILFALVFDVAADEELAPIDLVAVPGNAELTYLFGIVRSC